ncbi:MAG: hypothetical protein ACRECW_15080 [Phyllobacterium sp.]
MSRRQKNDAKGNIDCESNGEFPPFDQPRRKIIRILGRELPVPQSVLWRRSLGSALVAGGFLGFLPIVGFWMVPLGLLILSHDSAVVRRWRRRFEVKYLRKWKNR